LEEREGTMIGAFTQKITSMKIVRKKKVPFTVRSGNRALGTILLTA
jgi:hypothetical protein